MTIPAHQPKRFSQIFVVLALMIAVAISSRREAVAQTGASNTGSAPLRIPYEDKRTPEPRRETAPIKLPRSLTRTERDQLNRNRENAQRLAARSDESFRRALLPLGDHLRQLALSYSLRQSVATFGVGESREELNRQELARYRSIAGQLERLRQPASEGWAADLALANAHLARVEAERANIIGEVGAMKSALTRQIEWANRHVELRGIDEAVGMAAPRQLIEASQFERRSRLDSLPRYPTASEYRQAYREYRDDLNGLAQKVELWSELHVPNGRYNRLPFERGSDLRAPIGRIDKLHQARFALAQADAILGLLDGNEAGQRAALRTAENELNQMLESRMELYRNGTMGLFDLAETWQDRQSIYDQAADLDDFTSTTAQTKHTKDFERLEMFASQTLDRRGRIAADLEFITALRSEQEIAELRKSLSDPFRDGN